MVGRLRGLGWFAPFLDFSVSFLPLYLLVLKTEKPDVSSHTNIKYRSAPLVASGQSESYGTRPQYTIAGGCGEPGPSQSIPVAFPLPQRNGTQNSKC